MNIRKPYIYFTLYTAQITLYTLRHHFYTPHFAPFISQFTFYIAHFIILVFSLISTILEFVIMRVGIQVCGLHLVFNTSTYQFQPVGHSEPTVCPLIHLPAFSPKALQPQDRRSSEPLLAKQRHFELRSIQRPSLGFWLIPQTCVYIYMSYRQSYRNLKVVRSGLGMSNLDKNLHNR